MYFNVVLEKIPNSQKHGFFLPKHYRFEDLYLELVEQR